MKDAIFLQLRQENGSLFGKNESPGPSQLIKAKLAQRADVATLKAVLL